MTDSIDPKGARDARDEGIERVLANNKDWTLKVREYFDKIPQGTMGIFEHYRLLMTDDGCPEPKSHYAWGGVASGYIKSKILVHTGAYGRMKTKKSHARESKVLIKTI